LGLRFDALTQPQTTDGRLWSAIDLPNKRYIIGAAAMPLNCSVALKAPCIPDGGTLYTPAKGNCKPTNDPTTNQPCDFHNDPHFGNVVLAGKSFFDPPPVRDNWGPRIGVAWQLNPNTVLRAGYGLYWDTFAGRGQGAQNDLEYGIWPDATAFAGNPNTFSDFATAPATSKVITAIQGNFPTPLPEVNPWSKGGFALDPHYKDGYSQQWHVDIQRQITPNLMFSAAYVGSKNGRLSYEGKANAANQASVNPCVGPTDTPACRANFKLTVDTFRAMPWVSPSFTYAQSIGYSNYNALETMVQRRLANGLQSLVSYTYSKSIDVSSGFFGVENGNGGGSAVQNYYDQRTARGVSGYDITHFLSWFTIYELPAGRGKKWLQDGWASWILGNWQANYILSARSGQPYTLRVSPDIANVSGTGGVAGGSFTGYGRPDLVPGADPFQAGPVPSNPTKIGAKDCTKTISNGGLAADRVHTTETWFNPCAFTVPVGTFGNLGRNAFRGPAVFNVDVSAIKRFQLPKEGWNLQLHFDAFNVFNIQNWDTPTTSPGDAGLTVANADFGRIRTLAREPRQMQFGLRFAF
jgi:hypothetical protein